MNNCLNIERFIINMAKINETLSKLTDELQERLDRLENMVEENTADWVVYNSMVQCRISEVKYLLVHVQKLALDTLNER